ncbi:MAG TPA: exodeoxyribonuclease VII small subunit [Candidatus Xenobia bacterium]|nr:exodeoxyribonuclease VII small subunit [Candidatus Xenobia bacterium]
MAAPSFETSLHRLEQIVKKLEAGDLPLDDAMKLFEEGIQISQQCQKQLEEAENKVEILLKKADGKVVARKFELPGDESAEEN